MAKITKWTRPELLVAFYLYCRIPFGKFHRNNPELIRFATLLGRTTSALAMKLSNIASLDPEFVSSGRAGLSGASRADREMWAEMSSDWEAFAVESAQAVTNFVSRENDVDHSMSPDIEQDDIDYSGAEREAQIKTRIGQQFFRKAVLSSYDYRCCISGLNNEKLLIASHIVPWKEGQENRLNPRNGLCLSALHDKAFDIGLITITDEYTVLVSDALKHNPDPFLKTSILTYNQREILLPEKFRPDTAFLKFHREHVFETDKRRHD